MSTKNLRGLASIIVPCSNQITYTRQCISALNGHTRQPWELIVIDNGSTDHTDIYLAGVQDGAAVPVTVISNTTNLGFPAAINQGLKAARGEYLVLLNNDVVVTDGWLDQLVALANMSSRGGATPSSSDSTLIGCAEITPPPSAGPVVSFAETTPPPSPRPVVSFAETTPPPSASPVVSFSGDHPL